jgi:hypothetical protein
MKAQKFKIGDVVIVVKLLSLFTRNEEDLSDVYPGVVGSVGMIKSIDTKTCDLPLYEVELFDKKIDDKWGSFSCSHKELKKLTKGDELSKLLII